MTYFFEFIAWILYYHGSPVFTATGRRDLYSGFPKECRNSMLMTCQIWVVLLMVEMKGNQQ